MVAKSRKRVSKPTDSAAAPRASLPALRIDAEMSLFDAPGVEHENEMVVIAWGGPGQLRLKGWKVRDENARHTYTFKDVTVAAGANIKLHTGGDPKNDSRTDVYWGRRRAVWNNAGDVVHIIDPQGNILARHAFLPSAGKTQAVTRKKAPASKKKTPQRAQPAAKKKTSATKKLTVKKTSGVAKSQPPRSQATAAGSRSIKKKTARTASTAGENRKTTVKNKKKPASKTHIKKTAPKRTTSKRTTSKRTTSKKTTSKKATPKKATPRKTAPKQKTKTAAMQASVAETFVQPSMALLRQIRNDLARLEQDVAATKSLAQTLRELHEMQAATKSVLKVSKPVVEQHAETEIAVEASQPGVSYQLMIDGRAVGQAVEGNGSTILLPTGPLADGTTLVIRAAKISNPNVAVELEHYARVTSELRVNVIPSTG